MPKGNFYNMYEGENGVLELQLSSENEHKTIPSVNHSLIHLFFPPVMFCDIIHLHANKLQ